MSDGDKNAEDKSFRSELIRILDWIKKNKDIIGGGTNDKIAGESNTL